MPARGPPRDPRPPPSCLRLADSRRALRLLPPRAARVSLRPSGRTVPRPLGRPRPGPSLGPGAAPGPDRPGDPLELRAIHPRRKRAPERVEEPAEQPLLGELRRLGPQVVLEHGSELLERRDLL